MSNNVEITGLLRTPFRVGTEKCHAGVTITVDLDDELVRTDLARNKGLWTVVASGGGGSNVSPLTVPFNLNTAAQSTVLDTRGFRASTLRVTNYSQADGTIPLNVQFVVFTKSTDDDEWILVAPPNVGNAVPITSAAPYAGTWANGGFMNVGLLDDTVFLGFVIASNGPTSSPVDSGGGCTFAGPTYSTLDAVFRFSYVDPGEPNQALRLRITNSGSDWFLDFLLATNNSGTIITTYRDLASGVWPFISTGAGNGMDTAPVTPQGYTALDGGGNPGTVCAATFDLVLH